MNRIKELREDFGLTQTELAKEINTSQRNISRWEKDEIEMGANFAVTMAKYFNVSVEYLLGISNEDDLPALSNIVKNKKNPIADRPPSDIVTEKFIDEFKDLFSEKTFRHGSGYPHFCSRLYLQLSQKRWYEYGKGLKIAYYKSFCRMYLLYARSEV